MQTILIWIYGAYTGKNAEDSCLTINNLFSSRKDNGQFILTAVPDINLRFFSPRYNNLFLFWIIMFINENRVNENRGNGAIENHIG